MKTLWTFAALLALGGCSQRQSNDQQAQFANEGVQPLNAGNVDAGAGSTEAASPPSGVSSGMPVPGTNTPEHIVVNEDSTTDNRDK